MTNSEPDGGSVFRERLLLLLCVVVFVAFRAAWIGHLLVWDEAMTLCTARSFVSGGQDYFSHWLWRHPPMFCLLMTFLQPLKHGFAERTEIMSIVFGVLNLCLLFRLNKRLFGPAVALWSCYALAVLPGAVFYDTWIKSDHAVTTFGLLSLLFMLSNRSLYAGLCLGIAFLFKETAVFYAAAVLFVWFIGPAEQRRFKELAALLATAAVTCGWWYLGLVAEPGQGGTIFTRIAEHIRFAGRTDTGWQFPWDFYLRRLRGDLGAPGLLLAAAGMIMLLLPDRRDADSGPKSQAAFWPIVMLLPSYIALSLLPGKVPWIVICLFPALATLQGIGIGEGLRRLEVALAANRRDGSGRTARIVAACMALLMLVPVLGRDYEKTLRSIDADEGQWRGASLSREAARKMNDLTKDGERALVTSFHYWKGLGPGEPCAVFAYYFTNRVEILLRPHQASLGNLLDSIEWFELDWALLSPEPGAHQVETFVGLMEIYDPHPVKLRGACLFHTAEFAREASAPDGRNGQADQR